MSEEEKARSLPSARVRVADLFWLAIVVALVAWGVTRQNEQAIKASTLVEVREEMLQDVLEGIQERFVVVDRDFKELMARAEAIAMELRVADAKLAEAREVVGDLPNALRTLAFVLDSRLGGSDDLDEVFNRLGVEPLEGGTNSGPSAGF